MTTTTKKTTTRLYLVNGPTGGDRLVEATTAAAARNHCTRDEYAVEPAKALAVARLMAAGVKVEVAGAEPEAS